MQVNGMEVFRDPFFYSIEYLPLSSGTSARREIPIQSDSDFLITSLQGDVRSAETSETLIDTPAVLVLITLSGTGRIFMDRAQRWNNLVGTAQRPYFISVPKQVPANSTILFDCTNQAASDRFIRLTLGGYKIIPQAG